MTRVTGFLSGRPWPQLVIGAIGLIVLGLLLWTVIYRLFFQGSDLAVSKGNAVVATEQHKAEDHTVTQTLNAMADRQEFRDKLDITVRQEQDKVNGAWKGETVGDDVDRAGRAALCGVQPASFCGLPPTPEVQQVHPSELVGP